MKKTTIYAIVSGRVIILLLGLLFLTPLFLLYVLGQIAEHYLNALFAFVAQTKTLLAHFDHELKSSSK